jgi:hypothetical protein
MGTAHDMGGITLTVEDLKVGAIRPGQAGTSISAAELTFLDGVTAGTAAASKALVLGASSEIATITTATITNLTTTTVTPTTIAGTPSFSGAPTFSSTSTFTGAPTFNSDPIIGVGKTLNLDSSTVTLVSNAATITKYACQVTTEALTTAAGASQACVLTLTGVAATDLAFVTLAGGTNTRLLLGTQAVCTSNTITVTITNHEPTNAINGTVIFNLWVVKA